MSYETLLDHLDEAAPHEVDASGEPVRKPHLGGVFVGCLIGIEGARAEVLVPGLSDGSPCHAQIVGELSGRSIGNEVAVMFAGGDPARALVIGPLNRTFDRREPEGRPMLPPAKLVLDALEEITLRCGQASLILTRAGKVLIRGRYVSSRSSGVNRIKGGSVQIN
jgi:hypothetical protein